MKTLESINSRISELQSEIESLKKEAENSNAVNVAEELFLSMWKGLTIEIDPKQYPGRVFFFKGDKCYFELEKNGILWCHHDLVWDVLEVKLGTDYHGTQAFIKTKVEEHFKLGPVTPGIVKRVNIY